MKKTFLCLLTAIFPMCLLAQRTHQISLMGGAESHSNNYSGLFDFTTTGWNAGINYHGTIVGTKRWSFEAGSNVGIAEYNQHKLRITDVDTTPYLPSYGTIICPGYTAREVVYYSKHTFLRFQAGVNFTIFNGPKFKFSVGSAISNQVTLRYRSSGEGVLIPLENHPELNAVYYSKNKTGKQDENGNGRVAFQLYPHLDFSYVLSELLSLDLRLGYYQRFFAANYNDNEGVFQLNAGISYELPYKE